MFVPLVHCQHSRCSRQFKHHQRTHGFKLFPLRSTMSSQPAPFGCRSVDAGAILNVMMGIVTLGKCKTRDASGEV